MWAGSLDNNGEQGNWDRAEIGAASNSPSVGRRANYNISSYSLLVTCPEQERTRAVIFPSNKRRKTGKKYKNLALSLFLSSLFLSFFSIPFLRCCQLSISSRPTISYTISRNKTRQSRFRQHNSVKMKYTTATLAVLAGIASAHDNPFGDSIPHCAVCD